MSSRRRTVSLDYGGHSKLVMPSLREQHRYLPVLETPADPQKIRALNPWMLEVCAACAHPSRTAFAS